MNYQKLYNLMIDAVEKAIEAIDGGDPLNAKNILINAEQQAEDLYIEASPTEE
ncbi:MAG: hypothetical protein J5449_10735 [Oscillospiraceae bacterium]|nr:hypothetical protein [Oscillospiraceae bacterium]